MSQSKRCKIIVASLVVLSLCTRSREITAEWLDIRPMRTTDADTLHVHFNDPLLSPLESSTSHTATTAAPPNPFTIYDRVGVAITVLPKPLAGSDASSHESTATIVPPIRYEDLEHIVGPGFEAELEKFYEQHKLELDESTRRSDVGESGSRNKSSSSNKPPKIYYVPGDDDPWSQYDKPMLTAQQPQSTSTEKSDNESDSSVFSADSISSNRTKSPTTNTTNTKKRITKLVPVRVVAVPAQLVHKQTAGAGGFLGVVTFLRGIQDSIVSNTSRSIQDKMRMLKSLRDKMMLRIKKNIRKLWPSGSALKRTSSRTKREAESSIHSMDFPSSEGALMTISFLTFAVFLIKLVLQVINTIKSKHYSYNTFDTVNTGATVSALNVIKQNRNARQVSLSDEDGLYATLTPGGLSVGSVLKAVDAIKH